LFEVVHNVLGMHAMVAKAKKQNFAVSRLNRD
jgi:hypothetical protein